MKQYPRYWKPLIQVENPSPEERLRSDITKVAARDWNCSIEEAARRIAEYDSKCEYWRNHLYQVQKRVHDEVWIHLNIRRVDGAPIHDWRHLQQIKNELLGEECEALELYPAESRKVDATNKYHLWGLRDPKERIQVGFDELDVSYDTQGDSPGLRQRTL